MQVTVEPEWRRTSVCVDTQLLLSLRCRLLDLAHWPLLADLPCRQSLTPSLTHSLPHSLARSLPHSLTHTLTHSLTHSLSHSMTYSLTH